MYRRGGRTGLRGSRRLSANAIDTSLVYDMYMSLRLEPLL